MAILCWAAKNSLRGTTTLLLLMIVSTRIVYWLPLTGTMSREFLLQIFFMNHLPPSP
jgi:hypothetical protein